LNTDAKRCEESERLFREQENGLGVGNRLTRIGLAKAFLDLCQEAEAFDRILKRGSIRKPLHDLKDLLFDRFGSHRNHLIRLESLADTLEREGLLNDRHA
jgi:hypothetical protein